MLVENIIIHYYYYYYYTLFYKTFFNISQGLEKYLMTKIYHNTFGVSELDRERDEALHVRMRALNFIKPSHLDIPELYRDEKAWILAMKELHKINNYKVLSVSLATAFCVFA